MKKSLLALAVLGAFAGAASAQSSVTLFGIVDVNVRAVKDGDAKTVKQVANDGLNSSRLGFRGVEDLGGGLKAGFWLEGGLSADDGNASGFNFRRRSTVSLLGNFGEVRLGRDYTPTFWNLTVFDPFGTNGVASLLNLVSVGGATQTANTTVSSTAFNLVRANNTVGYFLPSGLGGIYGQAQVAAGEGADANKYAGARIGYAAGPFDVAVSYGQNGTSTSGKLKLANVGGAYDFGMAKVTAQFIQEKFLSVKQNTWQLGAVVPMGQGEIHAAYAHGNMTGGTIAGTTDADDANLMGVGYVYNLSKRTAFYGNYARLANKGASRLAVGGYPSNSSTTLPAAFLGGQTSQGAEVGIRHSF